MLTDIPNHNQNGVSRREMLTRCGAGFGAVALAGGRLARGRGYIWEIVERDLPTLAICRGIQSLNVALGGTLIQHVDDQMIEEKWNDIAHTVRVEEGSKLADRIGAGVFEVNSLHHQVVGDLGDRAVAVAWNEEGHVEALEVDGAPHVLGIQWHPELLRHRPEHLALFEHLVGDAAERR